MSFSRTYDGPEPIRINKWLGQSGVCSRREADALIADGLVSVDGEVVTDAGRKLEPGQTLTGHARVGIDQAGHHPGHAGLDQGVAARAGAALVGARLERDIGTGTTHRMAAGGRIAQRHHLCVGVAGGLGVAFADDLPRRVDQHTADRWIGRSQQAGLGRQLERAFNHGGCLGVHWAAV